MVHTQNALVAANRGEGHIRGGRWPHRDRIGARDRGRCWRERRSQLCDGSEVRRCGRLGTPRHATHHLTRHDEVGRDDHREVERLDPPRRQPKPAAEDEPGSVLLQRIQDELPAPVDRRAIPFSPLRRQMLTRVQHKAAVGSNSATTNAVCLSGAPSSTLSPTCRPCHSGCSRSALGALSGNSSRSTQLRCRSSGVAPYVRPSHCSSAYPAPAAPEWHYRAVRRSPGTERERHIQCTPPAAEGAEGLSIPIALVVAGVYMCRLSSWGAPVPVIGQLGWPVTSHVPPKERGWTRASRAAARAARPPHGRTVEALIVRQTLVGDRWRCQGRVVRGWCLGHGLGPMRCCPSDREGQ